MELNRRYYSFVELKVTEKKLRFSRGLTEYFPPNPQLVKITKMASSILTLTESNAVFKTEAISEFSNSVMTKFIVFLVTSPSRVSLNVENDELENRLIHRYLYSVPV